MNEAGKKYQIIYADPPWQYDFTKDNSDAIERHYPTMSIEQICNIKIPIDDNAVLYLWATAPKLLEALQVIKAWGFTYKTHAIWDKQWIGMGYWFRGQHELLLVGVKGSMPPPIQSLRISSVWKERRTKHSKKPLGIRNMINRWYPLQTKIELFAREKAEGWDAWGNEVSNDIELSI